MTIVLSRENVLFLIILLLLVIQIHQYLTIAKLRRETESMWTQFANFILAVSTKMTEIDVKIKEDDK